MGLLRASELRVILKNGGLSDISEAMRDFSDTDTSIVWDSDDTAIYLGFKHQFNHRYFVIPTGVVPQSVLSVSFWSGAGWTQFKDVVDETQGFTRSGFVVWEPRPKDASWQSANRNVITELGGYSPVDGLYWVKLSLSDSNTVAISAIKFLLSDDRLMTDIFPEILEFLPTGKTNYLPQHELAKTSIVNILKSKKIIENESQIKNPEDWMLAATYKAVMLALAPISGDERLDRIKATMGQEFSKNVEIASASIDRDKDEVLSDAEDPDSKSSGAGMVTGWMHR